MNPQELLYWVRGAGLQISVAIFVFGMTYRMLHVALLGRKVNLAAPRGSQWWPGVRTIFRRSFYLPELTARGKFTVVAGYAFHLGFFITLFFLSQHIDMFKSIFGFGWKALPRSIIDLSAVFAITGLFALLMHRITDPVKNMLSGFQDYFTWVLSFLPLLSGFALLHGIGGDTTHLMILHLLTVELLLIVAPFTKLAHMLTTFSARWYNGAVAGYKGLKA